MGKFCLQAISSGKKIIITEVTIRRDLQLEDVKGIDCLSNADIFEQLILMGAKTTFMGRNLVALWCLPIICLAINQKFNFSKYIFKSMVKNLDNAGKEKDFRVSIQLFPTMVVQAQEEMGEGLAMPTDPHHTPIITQPSSSQPQRKQKSRRSKRKDTEVPQPSDPTNVADEAVNEEPSMQLKELMDFCTKLQQRVLDLENTKTAQAQEITSLKLRVKKLEKKGGSRTHKLKRLYKVGRSARIVSFDEASLGDQGDASKQGRKITNIDADAQITLVDETQERYRDEDMFRVHDLDGDEVVVENEVTDKAVSASTITNVELTLAQILAELKSARPKTKWVVMQEPSESTLTISLQLPSQVKGQGSKDKGKAKMIEPDKPLKKKDHIKFDEEEALRLQAEFDEEDRLAREKAQQIAGTETKELTMKESLLVAIHLEKEKILYSKKRNRPPTRAQQRSIMCSEIKAEGSETREERSSKRARDELEQEKAIKQKVDDDQQAAKMKELMKIVPDEEEVAVDAILLATKPPSIVRIVRIKRLLDDLEVTAAQVRVTAAKHKLVLSVILMKNMLSANAAGIKVTTASVHS
ncbi:hypothetical protein Tco_1548673 [Tanacetum coccineum]